ncbi:retrotransposon hobase [Fusarium circinatum]|uniref:Retrotransposon hobase n=1 Tax=Fusarium circinatum TaxID=48490 RepID=A0A8H5TEN3_FUSCI|nr:retrotransposon hobase [Fusarium circinatum]
MMEVQYSKKVKVFECDNEITATHPQVYAEIVKQGIRCEPSAPNTQAQNGGAERVAAVIIQKSRAMRAGAKIPEYLWPESIKAATYLYNRTPSVRRQHKSPYEIFHLACIAEQSAKPDLSHLRAYGCKGFALTRDAQLRLNRLHRQAPKAWIGYLVGYTSSNSYRIWNPLNKEVFTTRDVTFNEQQHFDGNMATLRDDLRNENLAAIEKRIKELISLQQDQPNQWQTHLADEEPDEIADEYTEFRSTEADDSAKDGEPSEQYTQFRFEVLPTPPESPLSGFLHVLARDLDVKRGDKTVSRTLAETQASNRIPFNAAFLAGTLQHKIHVGTRRKTQGRKSQESLANSENSPKGGSLPQPLNQSSAGKRESQRDRTSSALGEEKGPSVGTHWKLLERLPSSHTNIKSHPYRDAIQRAEEAHLESHKLSRSWTEVAKTTAKGHRILGCHWVYVYKLDKHGRFLKIKARLVVRGDQQAKDGRDTYAATLAGMSFRVLMAIATRFDYEMLQYDAVNAFVQSTLDEEIYMEMPIGYRKPGVVLKLQKALYGLRRSPLLWQKHFEKGLLQTGFRRVLGEDCCWIQDDIIFFFYVDDCVLCYPKEQEEKAKGQMKRLQEIYQIEGGKTL